jgi:hypothetical protein
MDVSDEELARRRTDWVAPPLKVSSGTLYKYTKVRPSLPLTLEASLRAHLM